MTLTGGLVMALAIAWVVILLMAWPLIVRSIALVGIAKCPHLSGETLAGLAREALAASGAKKMVS